MEILWKSFISPLEVLHKSFRSPSEVLKGPWEVLLQPKIKLEAKLQIKIMILFYIDNCKYCRVGNNFLSVIVFWNRADLSLSVFSLFDVEIWLIQHDKSYFTFIVIGLIICLDSLKFICLKSYYVSRINHLWRHMHVPLKKFTVDNSF